MARISTYPLDTEIVGTDKWIGSDSQNYYATKNFTVNSIVEYINTDNKVESNSLRYRYEDFDSVVGRQEGTISFASTIGANKSFSTVTTFMISKFQYKRLTDSLGDFYTAPLIGSMVMISQCDKISNWGVFNWNTSTLDPVETTFYDIALQYVSGPGDFQDNLDYFITILQYDTSLSNDKNFVHHQSVASSTWMVTHNLNKYCAVDVVNDAGDIIYPNVDYTSLNTVTITFSSNQTGYAYFN
tara:strand:+ start:1322 stop:2047 length:726 start_codon:yes stop_codon:yes gene_type:complete